MTAMTELASERSDQVAAGDAVRPAFRAVFHRGPEGLTLQWVVQRERRDGDVLIVVGEPLPTPPIPLMLEEPGDARSAAD